MIHIFLKSYYYNNNFGYGNFIDYRLNCLFLFEIPIENENRNDFWHISKIEKKITFYQRRKILVTIKNNSKSDF